MEVCNFLPQIIEIAVVGAFKDFEIFFQYQVLSLDGMAL